MQKDIAVFINTHPVPIEIDFLTFKGGEEHVKLDLSTLNQVPVTEVRIKARLINSQNLIRLLLVNDALEKSGFLSRNTTKVLDIGYMPAARQDRVCETGEALSLSVYASLINSIKADKVIIQDPHSDVTSALINHIQIISQTELITEKLGDKLKSANLTLVSPDAGALKKIYSTAKKLNLPVLEASKKRDTATGMITHTHIDDSNPLPQSVIIVDDICDGGRTFIELAKLLRQKGVETIYLYVTHGIFSQGLSVFEGHIDKIYAVNIWYDNIDIANQVLVDLSTPQI